jgi:hypothetical protein
MFIVKPCNVGGDPTQGLHGYTERREKPRMRGFPTAMNRGIDEGGAVGWVAQSGWSPAIWIPMKRDPEGFEAKVGGLDVKIYQAR